jgi:50S ribosomal subunit-associated GTPase HflX
VSAKTGKNVHELFDKIIDMIEEKYNQPILDQKIFEQDETPKLHKIAEVD